jgi:predicted secreted Zn-dependent protease
MQGGLKLCAITLCCLTIAANAGAPNSTPYDEFLAGVPSSVRRAYADENWSFVLARSKPAAENGNAHAQTMMGLLYYFGYGVQQSYSEAARWYELAAEQGHSVALANLADIYNEGLGVEVDYDHAHKLWKRAADRGNSLAMFNLGHHHMMGVGVPVNVCEAYHWWSRGARLGSGLSQDQLSVMFARGDGVPQDKVQAYVWSKLAERTLEKVADKAVAANRLKKLAGELTPQQLLQAEELAHERTPEELASSLPSCSPRVERYTIQYDIVGFTTNTLASQTYKHGPQLNGKRYSGLAFTNVAYWIDREPIGLQCKLMDVRTEVVVVNFEPRLLNPGKTPPRLLRRFSDFLEKLHAFQSGHADIAIEFAKEFRDRASRLPAAPTCGELEKSVTKLFDAMGASQSLRRQEFSKRNWDATRFPRVNRFVDLAEHVAVIATLSAKRLQSMLGSVL